MSIDKKIDSYLLKKLARLARLEISENKEKSLINDMNQIIEFVDQLNEVNTDDAIPLNSVTGHHLPLRKDKVSEGDISDSVLKNAPEKTSGYFVVPKVIE